MGYLVTKSREMAEGGSLDMAFQNLFRRVGSDDLMLFNIQLSKMVQVGIPLVSALNTLGEQTENPKLRAAVGNVARSVEGGTTFSDALNQHPGVFSALFVNMVQAGEASGKLDEIMRRLAIFAKRQGELQQQVKTAMTYPTVLLVVGAAVITLLVMGIIPKFMKIFLDAGVPLPLPTTLLFQLSLFMRGYWWAIGLAAIAAAAAIRMLHRTPEGRRRIDTWLLKIPVIGDLLRKAAISRLTRTLETLFSSGVPVLQSLAIAERTCGNEVIAGACRSVQTSVEKGGSLADPLQVSREFPPMVVQMIAVGEASGTMDHMLAEIAEHYDELVQHSLKRLTTLIEPFFLIVMGGMVAFIMASVLLPLFGMVNVIK